MADNNDQEIEKCIFCPKNFTELTKYNKEKHIESCKIKNGTPKDGNRNIKAFLIKFSIFRFRAIGNRGRSTLSEGLEVPLS